MPDFKSQKGGEESGFEQRDTHPKKLLGIIAMVLGGTALVALLSAGLFFWLFKRQPSPWVPEKAILEARRDFPAPQLQVNPPVDMERLRAEFQRETNEYGWVDRSKGQVRLPVERAMDLLLERGLPQTERKVTPLELQRERAMRPAGG